MTMNDAYLRQEYQRWVAERQRVQADYSKFPNRQTWERYNHCVNQEDTALKACLQAGFDPRRKT